MNEKIKRGAPASALEVLMQWAKHSKIMNIFFNVGKDSTTISLEYTGEKEEQKLRRAIVKKLNDANMSFPNRGDIYKEKSVESFFFDAVKKGDDALKDIEAEQQKRFNRFDIMKYITESWLGRKCISYFGR